MIDLPTVSVILQQLTIWTKFMQNCSRKATDDSATFMGLVYQLHQLNILLWHNEDEARRDDLDDAIQVKVKRESHRLNQARNDAIERVDEWLLDNAYSHLVNLDLPLRTETPGSALDRLSILNLKLYHMAERANRSDASEDYRKLCQRKLSVLNAQKMDLEKALLGTFDDLNAGNIRMKAYRQFKMYNNPS